LIPIDGRPVIARNILLLKSAGITDIVINLHHLAARIQDNVGDGQKYGVSLTYSLEPDLMGIGTAIKRSQKYLGSETFVCINGDIIADIDLSDVIAYHQEQKADVTLVLRPSPEAKEHGPLDTDGKVSLSTLIGENPDEAGYLMPTGIRVLGPRVFDYIPEGKAATLAETLDNMGRDRCHIEGYVMDGYWSELTSWEKYGHVLWELGRGFVPQAPEV
jgi:NDP-sugar pyrophosphorylase family protein